MWELPPHNVQNNASHTAFSDFNDELSTSFNQKTAKENSKLRPVQRPILLQSGPCAS
jgi:spore coat protein CotH